MSAVVLSPKRRVIEIEKALNDGNDELLEALNPIFMRSLHLMGSEHHMFVKKSCQSKLPFFLP